MKIARRIEHISEYYFASKLREIRSMQDAGVDVVNLGIGSPDMMPHGDVINALAASATRDGAFQYKPYRGINGLREAIKLWYERHFSVVLTEEMILPLVGSKEGIAFISFAFLNEGDEVLVPDPGYLAYQSATRLAGANLVPYHMRSESSWLPDPDEMERLITKRTRILWLNFPSMPAGVQADRAVVERLLAIAYDNDILVINDNPYGLILFEEAFSVHQIPRQGNVLELNSLSKCYNLAGMRFGMLTGDEKLIEAVFKVQSNLESGMFEPAQRAAICAMGLGDEWLAELNSTYGDRRRVAKSILEQLDCTVEGSHGGLFLWARIPATAENSITFVDSILKSYRIFMAPGSIFGVNGEQYIRLSLCSTVERLAEANGRISEMKKKES